MNAKNAAAVLLSIQFSAGSVAPLHAAKLDIKSLDFDGGIQVDVVQPALSQAHADEMLLKAAKNGDPAGVLRALRQQVRPANPNCRDANGSTPLMVAGNAAVLGVLLADKRTDPNLRDKKGRTALMRLLLRRAKIPVDGDAKLARARDWALVDNFRGIKELIADSRTRLNVRDRAGKAAVDYAEETEKTLRYAVDNYCRRISDSDDDEDDCVLAQKKRLTCSAGRASTAADLIAKADPTVTPLSQEDSAGDGGSPSSSGRSARDYGDVPYREPRHETSSESSSGGGRDMFFSGGGHIEAHSDGHVDSPTGGGYVTGDTIHFYNGKTCRMIGSTCQ